MFFLKLLVLTLISLNTYGNDNYLNQKLNVFGLVHLRVILFLVIANIIKKEVKIILQLCFFFIKDEINLIDLIEIMAFSYY